MDDMNLDELQKQARQQKEDAMKNILVKPSIWERLKKLPIYLHKEGTSKEHKAHISDEELARKMPKEREKFLSMVKEYPEVIEEIEKHPRLEQIVFTGDTLPSVYQARIPFSKRKFRTGGVTYYMLKSAEYKGKSKRGSQLEPEIAKTSIARQIQKDQATVAITLKPRVREPKKRTSQDIAGLVFHELRHVGQIESYHKQPKDLVRLFKGKYEKQKGEKQAYAYQRKNLEKLRENLYTKGRERHEGSLQNQEVQDAIRRANLALKGTI